MIHLSRVIVFLMGLFIIVSTTVVNAAPGDFDSKKDILVDDFEDASGSDPYSGGRYWYSFGGLSVMASNNGLQVSGNLPNWSGFGIDPTPTGMNGAVINAEGSPMMCIEFTGTAHLITEVYDNKYKKNEFNFGSKESMIRISKNGNKWVAFPLPTACINYNIAKIQFKFGPQKVDLVVKKIYFTGK